MLNTKYKKLCLIKCIKPFKGLTLNKTYRVIQKNDTSYSIINDYGFNNWYSKRLFKLKSDSRETYREKIKNMYERRNINNGK